MPFCMKVEPLTEDRFPEFVRLIQALAEYESLPAPDSAALDRLRADAFAPRPRFEAALAVDDTGQAAGYAIWFETYSSFLARPTMYLEDLFVLEPARGSGAGRLLFDHVRTLGNERGCGRMDWQVLDWNTSARQFYDRRGARWLHDWLTYRIEY
jgi:GNAT superfamily N-acetyltransferase